MRAAVLGAGVMGRKIAEVLLHGGADVALFSRTEATLRDAKRGLGGDAVEGASFSTSLEQAAGGANLVIESVPESPALKAQLLAAAERVAAQDSVLATNTSSLPLARLAEALARPERFLGWHWFNPADLVPLVEVVATDTTDPAVVEWSVARLTELGKRPLTLRCPPPGFLANRLQYALIREALQLVQDGHATPEQIDAVITECLGPRWAAIGPMRSSDLAGIPTAVAVATELYPQLSAAQLPQPLLRRLEREGRLGARAGAGFYDYEPADDPAADRDRRLRAVLDARDAVDP
jgi:3-hydroxybutyryl-CoA dehydrogenase